MKNSIIICEGRTDAILIQYYMRKALGWSDIEKEEIQRTAIGFEERRGRVLKKRNGEDQLQIVAAGGSTKLADTLYEALKRNDLSSPDLKEAFTNIVLITDRDDAESVPHAIKNIEEQLHAFGISYEERVVEGEWIGCTQRIKIGRELSMRILLLLIPTDEYGALETFLLKALSEIEYDRSIIEKGKKYVNEADPERRYLRRRRDLTKAEFNTYFAVRTPEDQFSQRQKVLLSVPWENYSQLNKEFVLLAEL